MLWPKTCGQNPGQRYEPWCLPCGAAGDSSGDGEKNKQMSQVLWAGPWPGGGGCLEHCKFSESSTSVDGSLPVPKVFNNKVESRVFFLLSLHSKKCQKEGAETVIKTLMKMDILIKT